MGGEVLLYFIVQVDFIEIQIWIEFKLVSNLEKIWKLKGFFQFLFGHEPNSTQLSLPWPHSRVA
jgi:hypothetical protein